MVPLLAQQAPALNYVVDLRKDRDFVRQIVNMITAKNPKAKPTDNPEPRPTVPSKSGKSVSISKTGFDVSELRNKIQEIKKASTGARDITIRFTQESNTMDAKV